MEMGSTVQVKHCEIGSGRPKICVPLVARTMNELTEAAEKALTINTDLVEWRVDFLEHIDQINYVIEALKVLRSILSNTPILFTCRTHKEGGEQAISDDAYLTLNEQIIQTGLIDLVDIELYTRKSIRQRLIDCSKENGIKTIISNHDFNQTPTKDIMIERMKKVELLGGDIGKIAIMPKERTDVLKLLAVTEELVRMHVNIPIITMAMGGMGLVTRLTGEVFGSSVTFAAIDQASAPGQINMNELKPILDTIHNSLNE